MGCQVKSKQADPEPIDGPKKTFVQNKGEPFKITYFLFHISWLQNNTLFKSMSEMTSELSKDLDQLSLDPSPSRPIPLATNIAGSRMTSKSVFPSKPRNPLQSGSWSPLP